MTEPHTHGNLSVVIPMDDMKLILQQMWKSRDTEPKMGELYDKYTKLIIFEN
jgi:hypothetical protein